MKSCLTFHPATSNQYHATPPVRAPMAKVVEFLPRDLFRVLINRNIIRPPTSSKADNLSFDVCLLGNCGEKNSSESCFQCPATSRRAQFYFL